MDLALSAFYDQAIGKVAAAGGVSERELRAWFDEKLITEGRTRASVYQGKRETAGLPNEAVRLLTDQHIIRSEERAGAKWFELVHDRFVTPIKESNAQWQLHRAEQNPLLRAAQAWQQGRGELYRSEQLQQALAVVATQKDVEPVVHDFLRAVRRRSSGTSWRRRNTRRRQKQELRVCSSIWWPGWSGWFF